MPPQEPWTTSSMDQTSSRSFQSFKRAAAHSLQNSILITAEQLSARDFAQVRSLSLQKHLQAANGTYQSNSRGTVAFGWWFGGVFVRGTVVAGRLHNDNTRTSNSLARLDASNSSMFGGSKLG